MSSCLYINGVDTFTFPYKNFKLNEYSIDYQCKQLYIVTDNLNDSEYS